MDGVVKKALLVISIVLIIFFFIFGIGYQKSSNNNFQFDGYIIESETNNKQYFANNAEYRLYKSKGIIEFHNTNNEKIVMPSDSFLHYLDGSVSVLKKAAVVDLTKMDQTSFQYYTVYEGAVFTKAGNDYRIDYLDKQLGFKNFLIKVSGDKYMIASPTLNVKIGENEQTVKSGFIELTYFDGDIVKIQNNELDLQNISSEIVIYIDDKTFIDVYNKKIYTIDDKNKPQFKINLGEITIDSDDYIEILPDGNNTIINSGLTNTTNTSKTDKDNDKDSDKDNNNNNNNGNNGGSSSSNEEDDEEVIIINKVIHQGDFGDVTSGLINAPEVDQEEETGEVTVVYKEPEYTINEFTVTANSMDASITVTDEDKLLTGTLYIKIIKLDDNQVVYYEQDNSNKATINVGIANLKPDTNYLLTLNRNYKKGEVNFNKDFVQKTFVTSSLGINIKKNYIKTDSARFTIEKSEYSDVTQCNYTLYDNTEQKDVIGGSGKLTVSNDNEENVLTFGNLDPNHEYVLELKDFVYGSTIVNDSKYSKAFKSLKSRPVLGTTTFSAMKIGNRIDVKLENIMDANNGAKTYRSEVYDVENGNFITSKTSTTNDIISFDVDGELIRSDTDYRVYTYLVFNDNEKEYEIPIGSDDVYMSDFDRPITTFQSDGDITFERIKGKIIIKDPTNVINVNEKITVTYKNESLGILPLTVDYNVRKTGDTIVLEFDKNNLKSNSIYWFTVNASIRSYKNNDSNETKEDDKGYVRSDISTFKVQTKSPYKMKAIFVDNTAKNKKDSFNVTFQLVDNDFNQPAILEASTMRSLMFKFYSVDYDINTSCTEKNHCWMQRFFDVNTDDNNDYNSSLKLDYYDNTIVINQDKLRIPKTSISYGQYYLEVVDAYDYTTYKNDLPIVAEPILINANSASGGVSNKTNPLTVTPIKNNATGSLLHRELNESTIVAYSLTANLASDAAEKIHVKSITYHMVEADTKNIIASVTIPSTDGGTVSGRFDFVNVLGSGPNDIVRGKKYYFTYTIDYVDLERNPNTGELTEIPEVQSENSEPSGTENVAKNSARLYIYQSNRDQSNIYYKYALIDPDLAIVDSIMYYYKDSDRDDITSIKLTVNEDNSSTKRDLIIPFTTGTLNGYYRNRLKSDDGLTKVTIIENTFGPYISTTTAANGLVFSMVDHNNYSSITFGNLGSLSGNLISADVTLSGGGITKTFFNKPISSNNTIDIFYSFIKEFKSPDSDNPIDINVSVKAYYDTGVYGIESADLGFGHAIQYANNTYHNYDGSARYRITGFGMLPNNVTSQINFINYDDSTKKEIYTYMHSLANIRILEDGKYQSVSIKQVNTADATCHDKCTFSFDSIKPTMRITTEEAGVTTAYIKGQVDGIEDEYINDLTIKIKGYKCNNNNCDYLNTTYEDTTPDIITGPYTLDEFNADGKRTISGLKRNQKYRFYYYWSSGSIVDETFYFTNNDSTLYYTEVTTSDNVGLGNAYARYLASSYMNYRRIALYFEIGILEGYSGIEYEIYTYDSNFNHKPVYYMEGNEQKELIIPPDTDLEALAATKVSDIAPAIKYIDIFNKLECNKTYRLSIKPYIMEGENKVYLGNGKSGIGFKLVLTRPKFTITKLNDNESFSKISIVGNDSYNASAGQRDYNVTLYDEDDGTDTFLDTGKIGVYKTIDNITCPNGHVCYVRVHYNYDILNNGELLEGIYSKKLFSGDQIIISQPIPTPTSNASVTRLMFTDSYKINRINEIRYTVYNTEGQIVENNSGFAPIWGSDSASIYYTDLPLYLPSDYEYELHVQFYYDGVLQDTKIVEIYK